MSIFTTSIVGTRFRGPEAVSMVGAMPRGLRVKLRREPDNEFDSLAIGVWYGTQHLGFIPRVHNVDLAPVLDRNGGTGEAEVVAEAIIDKGDVRFAPKIAVRLD